MTPEEERWAEALAIERMHGKKASLFIAGRIGAAAISGDAAAIGRWKEIAAKLDALAVRTSGPASN